MAAQAILVTGGAGYIGSHMVKLLLQSDYNVVTLDNLTSGYRDAVLGGEFVQGDLADTALLNELFSSYRFAAVMHFASHIQVGESSVNPAKYYRNNVVNTINLLDAMLQARVDHFIFSSSAAVYGEPRVSPIPESHDKAPISPYGKSKWFVEQILADYGLAHGLKSVSLRYFNAAGADPDGMLGERHEPETHLIPLVLRAAAGSLPNVKVFGCDYDTPDGTCIRDYVHVTDLCQAHLLALERLLDSGDTATFNLGNGNGFSVQEVIATAQRITGRDIPAIAVPRRPGDPARLVADSALVRARLGWRPRYERLDTIIEHTWARARKPRSAGRQ